MLTYVVVATRDGSRVDPGLVERARNSSALRLAHDPAEFVSWKSRGLVFAGWQSSHAPYGPHTHATGERFVAFAGWPWPLASSPGAWASNWVAELLSGVRAKPGDPADPSLFSGTYSIFYANSADRMATLFSDVLDTGLVYVAEAGNHWVFSNRADVTGQVAFGSLEKDDEAMAWMPFFTYMLDERTSFRGVRVLEPGAQVLFGPDGVRIHEGTPEWKRASLSRSSLTPTEIRERREGLGAALVSHAQTVARVPAPHRVVRLSGGKDSRLVLATLLAAGVADRFEFVTIGAPENADVRTAQHLADRYALDLRVVTPPQAQMDPVAFDLRLRLQAFQKSGMFGAWDLGDVPGITGNVELGGLFGEILKSHYAADASISSPESLRHHFRNVMRFDGARILRPQVARGLRRRVEAWVEQQLDDGVSPGEIVDGFYTEIRLRRWVGTAQEGNARNLHANLLQHPEVVRAGFAADHEQRRRDALHFELIRLLAPDLSKVPLAKATWHPDNYRDLPDADEHEAIEPIRSQAGGRPWQHAVWSRLVPVFRQHLLKLPPDGIDSVLEPGATAGAIERFLTMGRQGQECLWAALGASVWLADDELCARFPAAATDGQPVVLDDYVRDAIVITEAQRFSDFLPADDGPGSVPDSPTRAEVELERLRNRRSVRAALAVAGRYAVVKKRLGAARRIVGRRRPAPDESLPAPMPQQPGVAVADDGDHA